MTARPILFSAPMVRALLAGTKTQTRRAMKPQPADDIARATFPNPDAVGWRSSLRHKHGAQTAHFCPYGKPGDLLWVRETTIRVEEHGYIGPVYAASEQGTAMLDWGIRPAADDVCDVEPEDVRLRPAIHMPRKYSRLTLRITDVRVQRLQDISPEDARDEGVDRHSRKVRQMWLYGANEAKREATYLRACPWEYQDLWEQINGPGSWDANPWVWALTFSVIEENIDRVLQS